MKFVIKYGGNAMAEAADHAFVCEVNALLAQGHQVVIVHGGGPEVDRALASRSIETARLGGLRVTDHATLEITEAVLCGTLNKQMVRRFAQHNIKAAGISGQDGGSLVAQPARHTSDGDLGFVGSIESVNPELILCLLAGGFVPIVAPLALSADGKQAYNVNADTSAGALAAALEADALFLITNVEQVLADPDNASSGLPKLTLHEAREFTRSKGCQSSMRPKMLAAIDAVSGGVSAAYICAAKENAVASALAGHGTVISA